MCKRFSVALLALMLVGCGSTATNATATTVPNIAPTVTVLAASAPPPTAVPSIAPTVTVPATSASPSTAVPTATALAEGLVVRFGTPDPSPKCPEHYPWFFDNRADECATTLSNTWGVMEHFEHGLMVWFQEGGRTYIFIADGSPFMPYYEVMDTAGLSLPEADPSLAPPAGLYQPVLGFGKFWRGQVPGSEWVRERLGWATGLEVGYSALWQCNNASGDSARCYFTGPRDEVIVMTRGSVHYRNYWQGPVR